MRRALVLLIATLAACGSSSPAAGGGPDGGAGSSARGTGTAGSSEGGTAGTGSSGGADSAAGSSTDGGADRGSTGTANYCGWEICSAGVVDLQWDSLGTVEDRTVSPCSPSYQYIYTHGCAIPFSGQAVTGCLAVDVYNPAGGRLYNPAPGMGTDFFLVCLPPEEADGAAPLEGSSLFCKIDADCGEPVIALSFQSNKCGGKDVLVSDLCHPTNSDKELHGCRASVAYDNNGKMMNLDNVGGEMICR